MFGNRRHSLSSTVVVLVGAALFKFAGTGWVPLTDFLAAADKQRERTALVDSIVVPEGPPDELARLVHTVSQEALKLPQPPVADDNGSTSSEELAKRIFTGVKAADKLTVHPDATDEQRSTARKKKLTLLYLGAKSDRPMFAQPLYDYVDQLVEEEQSSDLAAVSTALRMEIRHFTKGASKDEVLPKLADYAKTWPRHPAGIELFRLYGERLEAKPDPTGARQCYEQAIALYGNVPEAEPLQRGLREAKLAEAQAAVQRRGERLAAEAERVRIKQKLGNYPDGYFVVYAEENVKPPRNGDIYFYHYEYEVLESVPAAISYAEGLSEKWSWKLVQRFPKDPEGREEAYALWKKLLRKKGTSGCTG